MSKRGGANDLRSAAFLCRTVAAARHAELAGLVVAPAGDAAAAAAHRVSADTAPVRHRAKGGDTLAHAVVADRAAPGSGRAGHSRRRRPDLESADRPRQ